MDLKKKLMALIIIIVVVSGHIIAADELKADKLLNEVISQLNEVKDFRGTIVAKLYLGDEVVDYRTGVMKSETRSMMQTIGKKKEIKEDEGQLLNSIPWIYLPPNYSVLKSSLPLEGQLDYQNPLQNLDKLYKIELLGEALYKDINAYIIQLENSFVLQRVYIDKQRKTILKIEVFNGANIKVASINYQDFKDFGVGLWLPTKVLLKNARNTKLLEVSYQDWKVNIGLTAFDFAQGFQEDYLTKIAKLKKKLDYNSQNDKLYWLISDLYYENGELDQAIFNLKEAINLSDQLKYRKRLATLYKNKAEYKKALTEIKAALQLDYNNASLHYLLGEINLHLGDINNSRYSLEKAVELEPKNTKYLERLFQVYDNLASENDSYLLERAEKTISKLVELNPDNSNYRIYAGDIYIKREQLVKAAQAYNKAIELDPEDSWGYIKLARFYHRAGRYNKAQELYRYIVYLDDTIENRRGLANFYFERSKYQLALKEYQIIKTRVANDLELRLKIAETYVAAGQDNKGLEIFEEILKEENNNSLYLEVAKIVKKYNLSAAIDIYHQALENSELLTTKQKDQVYQDLGYIYFAQVNQKQLESLDQLFNLNTKAQIYRLLGEYKLNDGHLDKAISYFKLAVNKQANTPNYYRLALSYLLIDQFELAKKEAKNLIALGAKAKGEALIKLADDLIKLRKKYEDKYLPGRINTLKGDKLRQQGKLNQALIKYQEAIFENYNCNLPYFYTGLINAISGNNLELELAKNGLDGEELELLNKMIDYLKDIK